MTTTWGRWYWPIFLVVVLGALLIPELAALFTNVRNTLSWWVWSQLRVQSGVPITRWTATHYLVFGAWLVVVSWLTGHFFFHRWAAR